MLDESRWRELETRFPELTKDKRTRATLRETAAFREVPAGSVLYRDGDECTHLPLLLAGELVLTKYGETGRAITLYRVEGGESCILSTLSILNDSVFPAEASTHGSASLVLVPAETLRRLVSADDDWRTFIFGMYHARLAGLISLIEEVVFGKLDVRLASTLLRRVSSGATEVSTTHQELAVELGSSREVVSRVLKEWERRGLIGLARGTIRIVSSEKLQEISSEGD